MSGQFVLAMAKHPPAIDPLTIRVEAGRLRIAGLSVPCEWQETGAAKLEIPIGTSLIEILRIGIQNTDEALEASGILEPIQDARRQCMSLIVKAANTLRPLGVRRTDVKDLVNDRIRNTDVEPKQPAFLEPIRDANDQDMTSIEKAVKTLSSFGVRAEDVSGLVNRARAGKKSKVSTTSKM